MKSFFTVKCINRRIDNQYNWYIQVWITDTMFADFKMTSNHDFESEILAKENMESILTKLEWNDNVSTYEKTS
jgi:hypothetical protein